MSGSGPTIEMHLPNKTKVPLGMSKHLQIIDWLTQTINSR